MHELNAIAVAVAFAFAVFVRGSAGDVPVCRGRIETRNRSGVDFADRRRRIVIERAVAVELRWACAAPMALLGWFAFPALTIAAERFEMTRLISRHSWPLGFLFATLNGSAIAWRSLHRRAPPTDPTP